MNLARQVNGPSVHNLWFFLGLAGLALLVLAIALWTSGGNGQHRR